MKIAFISPTLPFRSGIARHTHSLAVALAARDDVNVTVHSFSRLYPGFLFPGETDRNETVERPENYVVDYRIDSINPVTWVKAARRIRQSAPDLVIIPVWTFFVAPCLGAIARILRSKGIEVVALVHNAADHDSAPWKDFLLRFQLREADRYVTHNNSLADAIRVSNQNAEITVSPHPIYDDYPSAKGTLPQQRGLELLFFGLIRPYKGLDIALEALAQSKRNDVRLSIVGEFWSGKRETNALIERLGLRDRVDMVARYVRDDEAAEYFHRADAVLAPYRSATGSGVIALAQHYRRPVIGSDVAGLREAIRHKETGWIIPNGDEAALAQIIADPGLREKTIAMRPALDAEANDLSWVNFAGHVLGRHHD